MSDSMRARRHCHVRIRPDFKARPGQAAIHAMPPEPTVMSESLAFRCVALPVAQFVALFGLTDQALIERGMRRMSADAKPGYPCRVSLADADPGESVLLLPFEHQPAHSPYRASGPIFVRERAVQAHPAIGEVPDALRMRLLSVRGYDRAGMMVAADVVEGRVLEPVIGRLFADPDTQYLHLHNARPGCFACRVERA